MIAARRGGQRRRTLYGTLLGSVAMCALAQEPADVPTLERIEITGSNIPRSDAESSVPVQILSREAIARSGATTVAELMRQVSANVLGFNEQLAIGGFNKPGLTSANLRGIGDGSTLVLLNGRRVANYAFDGATVDLNSIPLAAVERVEILKDGASAIYGTDAIAGVINFILRKDYQGVELSGYGAWTEHRGGNQSAATITAGWGDLAKDRINVFATVDYRKDHVVRATDRPFSRTAYLPDEGVNGLSFFTFPANIVVPSQTTPVRSVVLNPTYATGCAPPTSIAVPGGAPICKFDYASLIDIVPAAERTSVVARATVDVGSGHRVFAEFVGARNQIDYATTPTPSGVSAVYPADGPFYPAAFSAMQGFAGDLPLLYRTTALGPRIDRVTTNAWHALVGAEGLVADWSYNAAVSYASTQERDYFASGYVSRELLSAALMTGLVNPFGPSGPEGDRLLRDAQITGDLHHARASTLLADARWSRDVFELAGGPVGIAAGVEGRRETLDNEFAEAFTSGDVAGTSTDGQSLSGARTVTALFVETIMPLAKGFEVQLAARYDHYSDFGGTVNPKIALRWQPARSIVLRGSWGTGFRAPPLPDLFTPIIHGTADGIEDPLRCPVTQSDADCNGLVTELTGGNRSLKAETSTQINAGVVLAPSNGFSLTLDYWRITKSNVIGVLPEFTILSDYARFAPGRVIRGPVDPANPELPGPIDSIVLVNENLGSLRTSGVDVDVVWRSPATMSGRFTFTLNGTYVIDWAQQLDGTTYTSGVGNVDVLGPIPRWKHHATLGWDYGAWAATLGQTFQSGYRDAAGRAPEAPPRDVSSYELWDLQGRYSGWKNTTLIVGVKNLFDRAPPFTNQRSSFQVGYDPSYADPRGRAYYLQLELAFK